MSDISDILASGDLDAIQRFVDDRAMPADARRAIEWAVSRVRAAEDPGFHAFVALAERFLEHYPADIFTGETGELGPGFVAALRRAVENLRASQRRQP